MRSHSVQELKLMADYSAWPLWLSGENVDPARFPISPELLDRLKGWSQSYDAILNRDDPASSGFSSPEAELAWEEQGRRLWHDLQDELGTEYIVTYFSETERQVLYPNHQRGTPGA